MGRPYLRKATSAGTLAVFLAACGLATPSTQSGAATAVTVLQWKPVEIWTELLAGPIRGQLTVWNGCGALHVTDGSTQEYMTLVWPPEPDYTVEVHGDSYRIGDRFGELRAESGDIVSLTGGGSSSQYRSSISKELVSPIPDGCSAPFWTVGNLELLSQTDQAYP